MITPAKTISGNLQFSFSCGHNLITRRVHKFDNAKEMSFSILICNLIGQRRWQLRWAWYTKKRRDAQGGAHTRRTHTHTYTHTGLISCCHNSIKNDKRNLLLCRDRKAAAAASSSLSGCIKKNFLRVCFHICWLSTKPTPAVVARARIYTNIEK
jgi:hypothetical protein